MTAHFKLFIFAVLAFSGLAYGANIKDRAPGECPVLRQCPAGLHFDTSVDVCNFPELAGCIPDLRVCEQDTLSLECPAGQTIMVDFANYGRYEGGDVCPHKTVTGDEYQCEAESSLAEVKSRCDGENSC